MSWRNFDKTATIMNKTKLYSIKFSFTKVVSLIPTHAEVYLIHHQVKKFEACLWLPPQIKFCFMYNTKLTSFCWRMVLEKWKEQFIHSIPHCTCIDVVTDYEDQQRWSTVKCKFRRYITARKVETVNMVG
jgi:hypothetical protein